MMTNTQSRRRRTILLGAGSVLSSLLLLVLLQACSPADDEPASETPREGVFNDQIDTLNKAESVEQQLKDSADAKRRTIEEQGG